jgi:hypothetical protein
MVTVFCLGTVQNKIIKIFLGNIRGILSGGGEFG